VILRVSEIRQSGQRHRGTKTLLGRRLFSARSGLGRSGNPQRMRREGTGNCISAFFERNYAMKVSLQVKDPYSGTKPPKKNKIKGGPPIEPWAMCKQVGKAGPFASRIRRERNLGGCRLAPGLACIRKEKPRKPEREKNANRGGHSDFQQKVVNRYVEQDQTLLDKRIIR